MTSLLKDYFFKFQNIENELDTYTNDLNLPWYIYVDGTTYENYGIYLKLNSKDEELHAAIKNMIASIIFTKMEDAELWKNNFISGISDSIKLFDTSSLESDELYSGSNEKQRFDKNFNTFIMDYKNMCNIVADALN